MDAGQTRYATPSPSKRQRRRGGLSRLARVAPVVWSTADPEAIREAPRGRASIEARDGLFRRALAVADVLSAAVALALCVGLLGDDALRPTTLLALPLIVAMGKVQGLYDRDELLVRKTTLDEAPQLFQLATLYALLFLLLDGVLLTGGLGDEQVVVLWAAFFLCALAARGGARVLARSLTREERLLFIGDPDSYARLDARLTDVHARLVARMSLQRKVDDASSRRSTTHQELADLVDWMDVHRVVIEPQVLPPREMLDLVRTAKAVGVRVSLIPRVLDVVGTAVVFDDLRGMTVLGVRRFGLSRSSQLVKRAFDVAGAGLALVVLAPVMAAIAIAVLLDSGGPVLFRQERVGRDGRRFAIRKFRTMCTDAEERRAELVHRNEVGGGLFKIAEDPRVTRVGRFLRGSSLDELPQLLNVLRGDMSLVGPRPLVVSEDELVTGYDRRRLSLTPGMTGPWQVAGSARVPLPEMVKIDYLYVASWSLWADMKILLRTVPYVLARRGM